MVVLEAVGRLVPGVMGNAASAGEESFSDGLLEYPQYTKPAEFRGWRVPEVLRSGDHARVARWRRAQALRRTLGAAPDLIEARGGLTDDERAPRWPTDGPATVGPTRRVGPRPGALRPAPELRVRRTGSRLVRCPSAPRAVVRPQPPARSPAAPDARSTSP